MRKLIVPFEKLTGAWIRNYLTKGLELIERAERQNKLETESHLTGVRTIGEVPHVDYRQQIAKADIAKQIDELRRKLDAF